MIKVSLCNVLLCVFETIPEIMHIRRRDEYMGGPPYYYNHCTELLGLQFHSEIRNAFNSRRVRCYSNKMFSFTL